MPLLLPAADRAVTPWANGLGTTSEVAIWPPNATLDDFAWRVSIADVVEESEFSALPGVDRTLVPLDGDGIRLSIDGSETDAAVFQPVRFNGGSRVSGGPIGGPTRDLNLMVRRGIAGGRLHIVDVTGAIALEPGQLAVVLRGTASVSGGEFDGAELGHTDAVYAEPGSEAAVIEADACLLAIITVQTA